MADSVVGPWAKDKLDRLGKYLHAYTTILRNQDCFEGYYYIDAFAGPGDHRIRSVDSQTEQSAQQALLDAWDYGQAQEDHQRFIAGSPRVALELEHPFTAYVFVELSESRVAALKALKTEYGNSREIRIRQTDCNRYLREHVVANRKVNWNRNRALVFLDPFGMQVPWKTIVELASTEAIEVFVNFPVGMAIQRLLPRDPAKFTPDHRAKLNDYFGSPEWYDILYRPQKNLFGDVNEEKIEKSGKALIQWYRERLCVAFGHVSRAALIRNTKGGHLYYLLLASPKAIGVKIADHILGAGEFV